MFDETLQKIKKALLSTSEIELDKNYDALLVKKLSSTNLLSRNREGKSSHQSHIALTGKNSFDFFPYIYISHYNDEEILDNEMKSFYVLQVPVTIYEKNIKYSTRDEMKLTYDSKGTVETKASVKFSRPSASQMELGNTKQSSEAFIEFRKVFFEGDYLILLKIKGQVKYEAFIIKEKDIDRYQLKNGTVFKPKTLAFTPVDLEKISDINQPENQITNANMISQGINRIYFGPPGTGKSYEIQEFIKKNGIENFEEKQGHPNVFRTTLHPEYSYHDFIGQIMPIVESLEDESENSRIEYQFVPQIFSNALARAFNEQIFGKQPVFLILEEMSRANVAAVFGDLFQLLDRDEEGNSEYMIHHPLISQEIFQGGNKDIYIPSNLFILGTVNTSDQNVFVMDTAFKRRFEFNYMNPSNLAKDVNNKIINNWVFQLKDNKSDEKYIEFSWIKLLMTLNKFIVTSEENGGLGLSEDKQLGQFFIKFKIINEMSSKEEIESINEYNYNQIKGKLLQYLWEDVEKITYSSRKLFKNEITTFSELYSNASQKLNFFSEELMHEYNK